MKPENNGKSSVYAKKCGLVSQENHSSLVHIPATGIGSRISDASKMIGNREIAAKMIGVSAPQLQRYIREQSSAPFDVIARLCHIAGVSMEWLATGDEHLFQQPAMSTSPQDWDTETLKVAIRTVEEMLQAMNRRLKPDQTAEAVLLVIELMRSGLPKPDVLSLAKRAIGLAHMSA